MFDVTNVTLHFGERPVLNDATFKVDNGERAAIIGPNGAGKSTLLKIIAGVMQAEKGSISYPKTTEIGYLPQEVVIDTDRTVEEECRTVFQEVLDHEQEMRDIEARMGDPKLDHAGAEYDEMMHRYDYLLHETMRRDIYSMDSNIGKVMAGLGFRAADLQKPCRTFSGGWQMRIALGKILLSNPDILLLDEPTNHLDIESIEWLGEWLSNHEGSVLMVSHERAFMDKLVNKVIEIDRGNVIVYRGNYSESLIKRDDRRDMARRAYINQQEEISHIQKFIDRFRYQASKAALVQSRIKMLEKKVLLEQPSEDQSTISFRFPPAPRSGKEVIAAENITKRYGINVVLDGVEFTMYRGEKVALVGVNGAGKSTLMKVLAGKTTPENGKVALGSNVELDYFAQYDYEDLHPDNTVLGEFLSVAPLSISEKARAILGAFLFRGDDIDKKIAVLSGGEKTRLRLARMLCGSANLLMLDEPTNHLDIGSRLTLENALKQYDGAVVLVSHDRYFLDAVVTRVVEVADGKATSYPGNYEDYLRMKDMQLAASGVAAAQAKAAGTGPTLSRGAAHLGESPSGKKSNGATPPAESREDRKKHQAERGKLSKDLQKKKKHLEELEEATARTDAKAREIENEMAKPGVATNPQKMRELTTLLTETRAELARIEEEWTLEEAAAEEMEALLAEE